jgi:hypothetical protein
MSETESEQPGAVTDDQLPEDLQPTDDNPLAKDPSETEEEDDGAGPGGDTKVEGMPDMGEPGPG